MFIAGILVGALCGAVGIKSLVAEQVAATAYLMVSTDDFKLDPIFYHKMVAATASRFKGKVLVEDDKPKAVDSSPLPVGTVSLLAFNSMDDLKAFWDSPAYQGTLRSIDKTSKLKFFALEGRPPM
jgi:uncharacterized protein (DUF1330 family)